MQPNSQTLRQCNVASYSSCHVAFVQVVEILTA